MVISILWWHTKRRTILSNSTSCLSFFDNNQFNDCCFDKSQSLPLKLMDRSKLSDHYTPSAYCFCINWFNCTSSQITVLHLLLNSQQNSKAVCVSHHIITIKTSSSFPLMYWLLFTLEPSRRLLSDCIRYCHSRFSG